MRKLCLFTFLIGFCGTVVAQDDNTSNALAGRIDTYLHGVHSTAHPLVGHGTTFVTEGSQYHVNPRFLVAISGGETTFGTHVCGSNNAFNWFWNGGCTNSPFDSWDSGIRTVSHFMQKSYILHGYTTIPTIQTKYCTSGCTNWIRLVGTFYGDLGGDPGAPVMWLGDAPVQEAGTGTTETPGPVPPAVTVEIAPHDQPVTALGTAVLTAQLTDVIRGGFPLSSNRTVAFSVTATAQDLGRLRPYTVSLLLDGGGVHEVIGSMTQVPATVGSATPQYHAGVVLTEERLKGKTLGVEMTLRDGSRNMKLLPRTLRSADLTAPAASHTTLIVSVCSAFGLLLLGGIGFAVARVTGQRKAIPVAAAAGVTK